MTAAKTHDKGKGSDPRAGEYVQVFLYRVPKTNHEAFASTMGKLAAIFRRCGVLRSDYFVLGDGRIFNGFKDLRAVLESGPGEEVWVD
jgi:hypothetical protein